MLLMRNNSFVTVTDSKGNKKFGASAGSVGSGKSTRYTCDATAELVARTAVNLGPTVIKVRGITMFKKKKDTILSWKEGSSYGDQSKILQIHDVTQLVHNGCRLPALFTDMKFSEMGTVECKTCSNKWSYQRLPKHIYGDYFVMRLGGIGKKVMLLLRRSTYTLSARKFRSLVFPTPPSMHTCNYTCHDDKISLRLFNELVFKNQLELYKAEYCFGTVTWNLGAYRIDGPIRDQCMLAQRSQVPQDVGNHHL